MGPEGLAGVGVLDGAAGAGWDWDVGWGCGGWMGLGCWMGVWGLDGTGVVDGAMGLDGATGAGCSLSSWNPLWGLWIHSHLCFGRCGEPSIWNAVLHGSQWSCSSLEHS